MSHKRCVLFLLLWTIANSPSPALGSGRGDVGGDGSQTEVQQAARNGSSSGSASVGAGNGGLRKSEGSVSDFLIIKSALAEDKAFSRVRRIRRQTSTEFLKVKLSSGSYVYRCVRVA